jgi:hypothetical protein
MLLSATVDVPTPGQIAVNFSQLTNEHMAGIQARIAFFQNQSNAVHPVNHSNFHPANILVPKPSGPGVPPLIPKVKLAPLDPVPSSPTESPHVDSHLPPLSDTDTQPKSNFRDKVAMLNAIKGGGMAQYDYKSRPVPEPAVVPEGRTPLPALIRPTRVVRKPTALD